MRGAARKPAEEPPPAKADLDARLAQVLDGQAELVTRATAMLDRCPDPRLLRQLITEVVGWGLHAEEMRAEMARYTAANAGGDSFFELGRAYERSLIQDAAATAAVPGPRHRRSGRWQPGEGQRALFSVPGIAAAAFLGLRRIAGHGTAVKLAAKASWIAAHPVTSAASLAGAGALTVAAVAAVPSSPLHHVLAPAPAASAPADGIAGAARIPSSVPAGALTRLKAGSADAKGAGKLAPVLQGPPPFGTTAGTAPSPPQDTSAPPASPAAEQAAGTLTVTSGGLLLGTGAGLSLGAGDGLGDPLAATLTLTASGGPVSWGAVSGRSADLSLSAAEGTLQDGESVTVTVSVSAAAQLLAGDVTLRIWTGSGPATVIPVTWEAAALPVPDPGLSP